MPDAPQRKTTRTKTTQPKPIVTKRQDKSYEAPDGLALHYVDFAGPASGVPVLCLHGLSRNARDFTELAERLCETRRVLALDFRGRGGSQWDATVTNYQAPTYVGDVLALLAHERLERVIIIGTSLGGIVGVGLAQVKPGAVAGLVLNDIGPVIDPEGLTRIGQYVGVGAVWSSWQEAAAVLKSVNQVVYPDFSDEDWTTYARNTCRESEDGTVTQDYDPAIAQGFADDSAANVDLWSVFDAISDIPALVLRGALSDLLSEKTVQAMVVRWPKLEAVTVPDRGHVPTLNEPAAASAIEAFISNVDNVKT